MKPRPIPRCLQIKISGLDCKILENACRPWGELCSYSDVYAFLERDNVDLIIRALKLYQIEYAPMSKNRKRTKALITQIEQVRSIKNDK